MRELPDAVKTYLEGYISTGDDLRTCSRAHVYLFRHAYRGGRYLKIRNTVGSRPDEATLESEAIAVQWLQEQSWVPHLVYYGNQNETEYLITDEIPGSSSENERFQSDIPQLLRMVAHGLRCIHNLAVSDFPLDGSVDTLLSRLERLVSLDLLKPEDFTRVGWHGSAQELLDHMHKVRPQLEESVLIHGDFCLPNILIQDDQVTGIVDWGFAGLGDRYRDFAAIVHSIGRNLGEQWVEHFFIEYGISELDQEKFRYHRLLYALV